MRILHVTQASFAGVLSSSTAIARAQAEVPGVEVTYAWAPRTVSPAPDQIQQMVGPRVRVIRLSHSPSAGTSTSCTCIRRSRGCSAASRP